MAASDQVHERVRVEPTAFETGNHVAVPEDDYIVGEALDLIEPMRDVENGGASGGDPAHNVEQGDDFPVLQ